MSRAGFSHLFVPCIILYENLVLSSSFVSTPYQVRAINKIIYKRFWLCADLSGQGRVELWDSAAFPCYSLSASTESNIARM